MERMISDRPASALPPEGGSHTAPVLAGSERGFTLVELLIAMAITTVILGTTMMAMSNAIKATDSASQITGLNNGLRTAMDLMVRDVMQIGQGLPAGRVVGLASGVNSTPMQLPGPIGSDFQLDGPSFCPPDPNDSTPDTVCEQIAAVVPGPARGPRLSEDSPPTDMITMVEADSAFDQVRLTAFAADGSSVNVNPAVNITDGGADDVRAGDLIMLTKGSSSSLVQVTNVAGQRLSFAVGDSLNLNQTGAAAGTLAQLRALAPADTPPVAPNTFVNTIATRIRLVTYYLDVTTDPSHPRLIRRMNNGDPLNFDNSLGTVVAFDVENLQITYDLADGVTNPSNVRMDDADLDGTGRCAPRSCSPNQIRKVNILLSGRSRLPMRTTGQFLHNTLVTQVSLRSLAFVDRYR
jgi:prepilin-type N-terminal cleavage/methylation domain-containing protein